MKDKYIAAKERWAAKRAGRAQRVVRSTDRLPPGQREATNFPVLEMGIQPEVARADWRLKIHGLVENPVTLDWEQFMALEQFADTSDFHCVTTWSQYDMEWRGVSFFTLTELVKPKDEVTHVFYKGYDGYSTNTTFDAVMADDTLIAHTWNTAAPRG
jgi:DMSO/TMAO reductase YedYZ molybdopterin-dependent catalytic subunit